MFGLCCEIIFTAVMNLFSKKAYNLIGHTSLWMLPIYSLGLTYGFDFVQYIILNDFIRYLSYPLWIWLVEILVGYPASQIGIRIWDYGYLSNNKTIKTIEKVGHPIILDACSNMGFAALLFSTIIPLSAVGGLMIFAMFACSLGTLTILASSIEIFKDKIH